LLDSDKLYLIPPGSAGHGWQQWGEAVGAAQSNISTVFPAARCWQGIVQDYQNADAAAFNRDVATYNDLIGQQLPDVSTRINFEALFNAASPFFWCIFLYVAVFVLACCSWLGFTTALRRSALALLFVTLGYHTIGLAGRVYISGHAPITNLYSSAVFIAWAGALLCVALELINRNGIATALAAAIAIPSLIIAYCLSGDGDTMAPLQAVLDTNLWLWTHVICVTLGYAATFVAGATGILYIMLGLFTKQLVLMENRKALSRMTYGILCFAMIFSFVGTILGGIWADQSWGRFWGWDPKENGAVLIVLWTALVLHARWCGWARERGVAALAVFGNIVTSWSWFGTNMLGVGLHSYGFMDRALVWLLGFVISQLLLVAMASTPLRLWKSYGRATAPIRRSATTFAGPDRYPLLAATA
jgi:ABC-type transport system involved in cytochrome c biogenesis permease subunit